MSLITLIMISSMINLCFWTNVFEYEYNYSEMLSTEYVYSISGIHS